MYVLQPYSCGRELIQGYCVFRQTWSVLVPQVVYFKLVSFTLCPASCGHAVATVEAVVRSPWYRLEGCMCVSPNRKLYKNTIPASHQVHVSFNLSAAERCGGNSKGNIWPIPAARLGLTTITQLRKFRNQLQRYIKGTLQNSLG